VNGRQTSFWDSARRAPWLLAAGVAVLIAFPAVAHADAQAAPGAAIAAADAAQTVDVVILADESGSMQQFPNETQGEQKAATQIVQEEWSAQSQVAIYGFGSAPPRAPMQAAIDQYCGPTQLTDAGRTRLAQCAAEIKPRTQAQGYNTDFAAALMQAKTVLGAAPPGSLPLIFILTDGKLDVGPDSSYAPKGLSPAQSDTVGNAKAQADITNVATGILGQLKGTGAEVWPVGFGGADQGELSLFARGGAQSACPAGSGSVPSAAIVPPGDTGVQETEAIQSKVLGAFANARCAVLDQVSWFPLAAGGSITKTVNISELATFGALIVDKGDPRVVISYTDPGGNKVSDNTGNGQPSGSFPDGTSYTLSGSVQSSLESLRLVNPYPGPWKVTFADPPGVPAQTVGVALVWQGEVQLEFVSQQVGDPGYRYQLAVQPTVRSKPVPAGALGALVTSFTVTWPGGSAKAMPARLDKPSGDFIAQSLIPAGTKAGNAHVTVTAASPGVQGEAATSFPVRPGGGLTVTLDLPRGKRVFPGTSLTVNATIATNNAPATRILLSLGGLSDGVNATIAHPSGAVQINSGRQTVPVTISFGKPNRLGPALGAIRWAPAGQGTPTSSDWLAFESLDVDIVNPPTPFLEQPWPWVGLVAALCAAGIYFFGRRWIHREDKYLDGQVAVAGSRYDQPGAGPRRRESKYGTPAGAGQPPPDGRPTKYGQAGGAPGADRHESREADE
jgi:hypothetical protein